MVKKFSELKTTSAKKRRQFYHVNKPFRDRITDPDHPRLMHNVKHLFKEELENNILSKEDLAEIDTEMRDNKVMV